MIEYLEDPIAEGDCIGYQKLLNKFHNTLPRVKIGIKSWFKSNLEAIKDVSQTIFNLKFVEYSNYCYWKGWGGRGEKEIRRRS